LINVNNVPRRDDLYHDEDEVVVLERYMAERLAAGRGHVDLLPRQRRAMANLALARGSRGELQALTVGLPAQLVSPIDKDGLRNDLLQQAQMALICAEAGLTVACDLEIGGFDTHQNHDANQGTALRRLTNGITYLWDTAEQLGLADRLVVLVGSDFGRTPRYNDGNGKDHWPINSAIIMKRGMAWANRVVGASDEGHRALPINPGTLAVDSGPNGVVIGPAHVQQALREATGVNTHEVARRFPLNVPTVAILRSSA
jgi:hypothetical protein